MNPFKSIPNLIVSLLFLFQWDQCTCKKIHITRFNIPRFEVHLNIDKSQTTLDANNIPSHHLSISSDLKSATLSYLMDYMESIFVTQAVDEESKRALEDIQLEVTLHAGTDGNDSNDNDSDDEENNKNNRNRQLKSTTMNSYSERQTLIAEMIGSIYVTQTKIGPNLVLNQDKIDHLMNDAFRGNYALHDYLSKMQLIIDGVVSVTVLSHEDLEQIALAAEREKQQKDGSNTEKKDGTVKVGTVLLILVILSTSLALCALVYREYQIRKYGRRGRGKGHLLMDTDLYSDYYDDDGDYNEMSHTTTSSSSYDTDPVQFIPVPARIDEVSYDGKKITKQPKNPEVTPRRFVSPASPFDLLYGAAFSHRDQAKVQSAHGIKVKKKLHRLSKTPKGRDLDNPLNTISESVDEEEQGNHESFFPQIMSTISSYINPDKRETIVSTAGAGAGAGVTEMTTMTETKAKGNDDFVVYRDFPRHDGTPCVMFAPVDEELDMDYNSKPPPTSAFQTNRDSVNNNNKNNNDNNNDDDDISYASSNDSYSKNDKEDVDCFVDKLENLMAVRSRQYEERKIMHQEMSERKRIHNEQRLREKDAMKVDNQTLKPVQDGSDSIINLNESSNVVRTEEKNDTFVIDDDGDEEEKVVDLLSLHTATDDVVEDKNKTSAFDEKEKITDLLSMNTTTEESNNDEFPYIHNTEPKEMNSDIVSNSIMSEQQSEGDKLQPSNVPSSSDGSFIKSTSVVPEIKTNQLDDDIVNNNEILDAKQDINDHRNQDNVDVPNTKHVISESSVSPRDVETLHFQEEEEEEVPQKQEETNIQNVVMVKEEQIM